MKKVLSLVLALSMVLGMFSFVSASNLKDITGTNYEAAVDGLVELGVVTGYPDGTYLPEKVVTRAEMAKMLVVALGQESAADLAKGATKFNDVASNHWAAGYINVASQNGVIMGYPDGAFKPETTVSYAEAITMAVRAAGYENVVKAGGGTWPTGHMTKAVELGMLDGIKTPNGNDGAKRGDIALLTWNMLTTEMWVIQSENATNGVTYAKGDKMLNIKFPDYTYAEKAEFVDWDYSDDGKITVTFNDGVDKDGAAVEFTREYAKNDFYKFIADKDGETKGTIVDVLYTDDDLLSMVPTAGENILVEGKAADLEEKYTNYTAGGKATYAYLLLSKSSKTAEILGKVELDGSASEYVSDVATKTNYTKVEVNDGTKSYKVGEGSTYEEDEILVLDGNERVSMLDVEVGDVLTWISKDKIAVLSRETEEGSFESYSEETTTDDTRTYVEVDGEEFEGIENMTIVELNDDEEYDTISSSAVTPKKNDYLGEDVTLYFNFLGEVVRMAFGEVNASAVKGDFFLVTRGETWSVADEDGAVWYIKLAGEDGEASYVLESEAVAKGVVESGKFYFVTYNDDDEIDAFYEVKDADIEKAEDFTVVAIAGAFDKDTNYFGSTEQKATADTVVFTAKEILDDDEESYVPARFELEVTEGPAELEGLTAEDGFVALKGKGDKATIRVAYAFVIGESTSTDKEFGILEARTTRAGIEYVTIDGTRYEEAKGSDTEAAVGSIVGYTLTDDKAKIVFEYAIGEIKDAGLVTDVDGSLITVGGKTIDLDLLAQAKGAEYAKYEDYRGFQVTVGYDKDNKPVFEEVEEVDLADLSVRKDDSVAESTESAIDKGVKAVIVIKGIDLEA